MPHFSSWFSFLDSMDSYNWDTPLSNSRIVNTVIAPSRARSCTTSVHIEDRCVRNAIGTNTPIQFLLVIQTQLAALHLTPHQLQPLLVIRLHDHFPSVSLLKGLLISESPHHYHSAVCEAVFSLSVHHLVGAKPLAHLVQIVVVVLEEVAVVYSSSQHQSKPRSWLHTGSAVFTPNTFQSISPWSMRAIAPNTLTW